MNAAAALDLRPSHPSSAVAAAVDAVEWIGLLFGHEDQAVWVTDTERFVLVRQYGRFNVDFKTGDPLKPDGTPARVLASGQRMERLVPPEVYGMACRSLAAPIDGGVIGVSFSVAEEQALQQDIGRLESAARTISETSGGIAQGAQGLAQFMARVEGDLESTRRELANIEAVGDLIASIADDTRFISLNALIEARRVGEVGRSFAVVANEMKALSVTTRESVRKVKQDLASIRSRFGVLGEAIAHAARDVDEQSGGAQKIVAGLSDVVDAIGRIEQAARRL